VTTLCYRGNVGVEDLEVGECTIHRAGDSSGARWWLLWFRVNRETDGQPDDFAVPVNPNGGWIELGSGGKTWGLTRIDNPDKVGRWQWQISPSINVTGSRALHPGVHEMAGLAPGYESLWHQTPIIVGVPDGEAWQVGVP
jgi:hypothetical protein